jgi:ATP-dependent DNA helicase RecG
LTLKGKNALLSNAGKMMADQYIVRTSRIFCICWNGLEKGSIFDDALNDKEYEGNLISLLRNDSKVHYATKLGVAWPSPIMPTGL